MSSACSASMNAHTPPARCASAMTCSASVVLPDDSGPYTSTMRPRGSPPVPSAMSRPSEPVETIPTSAAGASAPPSRMMAPLPNCFSMSPSTAPTALSFWFSFSMAPFLGEASMRRTYDRTGPSCRGRRPGAERARRAALLGHELVRAAHLLGQVLLLGQAVANRQDALLVVDVNARAELEPRNGGRVDVDEPPLRVLRHDVATAGLAPLAEAVGALAEGAELGGPFRDLHALRLPEREGVDGPRAPLPARAAVAVAHAGGRAGHGDLDGAAEASAFVCLVLGHGILLFVD